jgi:hypothetical protein
MGVIRKSRLTSITFPLLAVDIVVDALDRPGLVSIFRSCMLDMLARFDCPLAVLFRSVITSVEVSALVGLPVDPLADVLCTGSWKTA